MDESLDPMLGLNLIAFDLPFTYKKYSKWNALAVYFILLIDKVEPTRLEEAVLCLLDFYSNNRVRKYIRMELLTFPY